MDCSCWYELACVSHSVVVTYAHSLTLVDLFYPPPPTLAMQTRAAKRRCLRAENDGLSSPLLCLLPLLQPVHHCLHALLSDRDAARLMQTSRSITTTLLIDYALIDHVFSFDTITEAKRSFALYAGYHMRIVRLCLPRKWDAALIDGRNGRPVLPASLKALMLGPDSASGSIDMRATWFSSAAYAALEDEDEGEEARQKEDEKEESEEQRLIRTVEQCELGKWRVRPNSQCDQRFGYGPSNGRFNQPIPPGALPSGLRFLQLGNHFNQPLQQGSIPDTVDVLQFAECIQSAAASWSSANLAHSSAPSVATTLTTISLC